MYIYEQILFSNDDPTVGKVIKHFDIFQQLLLNVIHKLRGVSNCVFLSLSNFLCITLFILLIVPFLQGSFMQGKGSFLQVLNLAPGGAVSCQAAPEMDMNYS